MIPKEKNLKNGAVQGQNDFGKIGYGGPCPPEGETHRYYFRVYALKRKLKQEEGASRDDLLNAMEGSILDEGEYMGRYKRK
ncbi:MAG: YbhB/YbcL family Raf kinase inhibitor-like protein [Bacteroidales bacterium]|nr:YbhB/YbcL family Raf kinase inhibitor-like protein [Bacteroidales bacterium]MCF8343622.1 YbhB/YbcL family Raf kinase inhibitor-like protein [Bacteroidales bacterium]MCF8350108.1 YbhB/YbcL family Raf kinase inhibitor-like protein [Bacteroidales bacterium]MCF8376166.1 YbhB/YbcL family Raf kinase inhibitor-like protein [Bacteroidales bacterium]